MPTASSDAPAPRKATGQPDIYVEQNDALPVVSIAVALRSGASSDPVGKEGLTRVMVRMLRRGCRGLKSHELEETIDILGAEVSADVSPSVITVHADVITRSLDQLVDLLATMMAQPTFDEVELGKLLRETQGEIIEARDSDRSLETRHFGRLVFDAHPYGRRLGGTIPSVLGLTRQDVVNHYQRHFARRNVSIAFSGDIDESRAADLTARLVSGLGDRAPTADVFESPESRGGRRLLFVDKPERTQTQILMGDGGSHQRDSD